jgi:hypothetical protein
VVVFTVKFASLWNHWGDFGWCHLVGGGRKWLDRNGENGRGKIKIRWK